MLFYLLYTDDSAFCRGTVLSLLINEYLEYRIANPMEQYPVRPVDDVDTTLG